MTEFSYVETVDVRLQDHDTMGHVNNAVYVTYLEEGRVAYLTDGVGVSWDELNIVVANLTVDFHHPIEYARSVDVAVSVTDVGGTSFTMAYEIRDEAGVAVEAESVQVTVDPDTKSPRSVPDAWRRGFDKLEG